MDREVVKIADLKAAPYNPRRISKEAADGLTKSLERWGVVQEVVANKRTGHIVGGHQRVAALRKMGVKEVPVVWVDLDDVEEKALNVALNNPHISGEFDDTIAGLLAEIRDGIGPDDFAELKLDELIPGSVDYSILEDEDLEEQLDEMEKSVKKAIQIEFESEDHEEAQSLVKYWRERGAYVGRMLIEKLKQEKEKL